MSPETSAARGPLAGYRIVDMTSVIMGPYATQLLADMGADVITVERPEGDGNRSMDAGPHPQLSGIALNILRSKRNICLDVRAEADRETLLDLIATADVVVTNLRPGVLQRLRMTYDDVRERRPDIVFCQAHGYASDTPQADQPAYDDIVQAASGLADAARRATGEPALMPTILADKVCAMAIVYSVTAALAHRERTGEGEHIEVPMVDVMRSFTLVEHGAAGIHAPYQGRAGYRRLLTPERRPQATADGWVDLLPYSREHYDALFSVHLPEMVGDERYQTLRARIDNSDLLYQKVREVLVTDTTVAWEAFCASRGIPFSVVTSLDDLVDALPDAEHPVVGTYKSIPFPIRFANAGVAEVRPAPLIDEHAAEIRTEIDDRRRHAGHCQT